VADENRSRRECRPRARSAPHPDGADSDPVADPRRIAGKVAACRRRSPGTRRTAAPNKPPSVHFGPARFYEVFTWHPNTVGTRYQSSLVLTCKTTVESQNTSFKMNKSPPDTQSRHVHPRKTAWDSGADESGGSRLGRLISLLKLSRSSAATARPSPLIPSHPPKKSGSGFKLAVAGRRRSSYHHVVRSFPTTPRPRDDRSPGPNAPGFMASSMACGRSAVKWTSRSIRNLLLV